MLLTNKLQPFSVLIAIHFQQFHTATPELVPLAFGVIMRVNSQPNFPSRRLIQPELNNLKMPFY
ncbi:hypothetical protein C4K03_4775 [Pseudomonas synxantha]|uniref:Uncharacterized protein n=1 Tax=Pseudomonas synxantha TaxID=47883 RepID=A0A3G7UCA9_9PSED|nr:hypothetical protein C4K03_4775 [Pseudomonas synxantha]